MANNVNITPGTGDVVAAESISSVKYQLVKLVDGTGASATPITATGGALDINIKSGSSGLPTGAATSALQGTGNTSVGNIDTTIGAKTDAKSAATDATSTSLISIMKEVSYLLQNALTITANSTIDMNKVAGTTTDVNSGNKSAGSQRVVIATDDVNISSIKTTVGAVTGSGAVSIDSYTTAAISAVTGANQHVASAPGANKQIWVYGYAFTISAAGTVQFQDTDNTALTGVMPIDTKSGLVVSPSGNFAMPVIKVATNKGLDLEVATGTIDGWICYATVSV